MSPFVLPSYRRPVVSLIMAGFCMLLVACMAAPTDPAPTVEKIDLTQESSVHPEAAPLNTVTDAPERDHPSVTATPPEEFKPFSLVKIEAPALENNLIGEKSQRSFWLYLPPSYPTSTASYPVVYYLPGFGDSGMLGFQLPRDMNQLIEDGKIEEMILVVVPGTNLLGGSFYVNSPVTGNWEDFIVHDVVGYVDSHYRTLAQSGSRGISGHSMGGFGALDIAMKHPDVFGAVYSLSPGLFDENGLAESQMFNSTRTIDAFLDAQQQILAKPREEAQSVVLHMPDQFTAAYASAFAPNPENPPFYFDYPYSRVNGETVKDESVWQRWESGFGAVRQEIAEHKDNLLRLKGMVIDVGDRDEYAWIPKGCTYYAEQLTAAGIPHELRTYDGRHQDQLASRIREHMLPFFSELLER